MARVWKREPWQLLDSCRNGLRTGPWTAACGAKTRDRPITHTFTAVPNHDTSLQNLCCIGNSYCYVATLSRPATGSAMPHLSSRHLSLCFRSSVRVRFMPVFGCPGTGGLGGPEFIHSFSPTGTFKSLASTSPNPNHGLQNLKCVLMLV